MSARRLAFGVEPSRYRYRLRLARYPALAEAVETYVKQHAQAGRRLRLLDVGVGRGRSYDYVRARGVASRLEWYGVDSRRLPADAAGSGVWRLQLADVERGLPFVSQAFDVVIAEQILEHLHHPRLVLEEIRRVARPGGLVLIGVPIFPSWMAWLRNQYIARLPRLFERSGSGHVQSFSARSIRRLVTEVGGLAVTDCRGFRILSGGILRPLEDFHWWYAFNRRLGRRVPGLCIEIQLRLERREMPR